MPADVRCSMEAWAGITSVDLEVTRVYGAEQDCCDGACTPQEAAFQALDANASRFVSAFVRATRPRT